MQKQKALIVVDLQRDFCPGGSLAVPEGDTIVEEINELLPKFDLIIFTKDWHDPEMNAFASQHEGKTPYQMYKTAQGENDILWPDHCVKDTEGAEFHKNLDFSKCMKDFYIFKKGMKKEYHPYSAFGDTELKEFLDERKVKEVYICGLATDYCVKDTAVDSSLSGYDTYVIRDACKGINSDLTETYGIFKDAGIMTIDTWVLDYLLSK